MVHTHHRAPGILCLVGTLRFAHPTTATLHPPHPQNHHAHPHSTVGTLRLAHPTTATLHLTVGWAKAAGRAHHTRKTTTPIRTARWARCALPTLQPRSCTHRRVG